MSWFGFLLRGLLFAGVCAGGYFGYKEYLRRNMYAGGGNFGGMRSGGGGGYGGGGGMYSNSKRF